MEQTHNSIFSDHYDTNLSPRQSIAKAGVAEEPRLKRRKYDILYLDRAGHMSDQSLMAAAHPAFEHAFSVIKQGALVQSEHGIVEIERVYPGDRLRLANGAYELVQWRGALTLGADDLDPDAPLAQLTRITSDAFGLNRPSGDLVLGHGARILHRAPGIRRVSDKDMAFIPASDFIDGNTMIRLHTAISVTFYQIGFHGQRALDVDGVAVETLHPGTPFNLGLRGDMLRNFLSLFPHKSSFEDFGLLQTPRLRLRDLDLLN